MAQFKLIITVDYDPRNSKANTDDIEAALEDYGDKILEAEDLVVSGFKITDARYEIKETL